MDQADARVAGALASALLAVACGASGSEPAPGERALAAPYATELVVFEPGEGAGFGQDELPEVVLGAPKGKGTGAGSLDVLSLGRQGSIVLGFGPRSIVDGEGADFVVFENPFWAGGDPTAVFAEPGEVSVSLDGEHWDTFACDPEGEGEGRYPGCAGWTPTLEYDPALVSDFAPEVTGGDGFDLAELGLAEARYVRIRDAGDQGSAPIAGFDLDAVGVVHAGEAEP
ncbi:MAG TPA: hypothetical protein VGK73_37430 [Polyangiaceae bacterium]